MRGNLYMGNTRSSTNMIKEIRESIWQQFGASIDMLINVISNCPDDYFKKNRRFYYLAYHSTIFLDYYLTLPPKEFSPTLTFTSKPVEHRPAESIGNMIPDEIFCKEQLIDYLVRSRFKCRNLIESLKDEHKFEERFVEGDEDGDMNYSILEILLYNMRHTQHHIGQLNLMMRQDLDQHMNWAFRVDELKVY